MVPIQRAATVLTRPALFPLHACAASAGPEGAVLVDTLPFIRTSVFGGFGAGGDGVGGAASAAGGSGGGMRALARSASHGLTAEAIQLMD